jgi:hypothetical protein
LVAPLPIVESAGDNVAECVLSCKAQVAGA